MLNCSCCNSLLEYISFCSPWLFNSAPLTFCRVYCWLPPPKEVMFLVRSVCLFVCLSVGLLANLWTDFDKIFWRGRAWLKDQVIQFWWRSGSCFGSGSPKSEIRILWIGGGLWSLSISSFWVIFRIIPSSLWLIYQFLLDLSECLMDVENSKTSLFSLCLSCTILCLYVAFYLLRTSSIVLLVLC